jgi:large subunit ribosomal protein L17
MLKKINKIKMHGGQDSNQSIMRKMSVNFFLHGKITTTLKRANYIKARVDRIVNYAKNGKKILVMKRLNNKEVTEKVMNIIAPAMNDRKSGFLKMTKLGLRFGDRAEMVKLEFVNPIVEVKKEEVKKVEKISEAKPAAAKSSSEAKKVTKKEVK